MSDINDIDIKFSTKRLPFEYKWLEFKLIVNKELYDEKIIDLKVFKKMEESLLTRLSKIKNEYKTNNYFLNFKSLKRR